jgi:hypothetical protein
VAEQSRAGSLVVSEVDLAAVATLNLPLLAQLALADLEGLLGDQVGFVVASAVVSMVDVAGVDTEAVSRIGPAMLVAEEALAIKVEEALHPEVDTAAIVAEVEIVVGMAATRHQMLLLDLEVDVVVVSHPQVGMDVVVTADQDLPIETAQHQLEPRRQLEVGMIHVAHMMTDPAEVIVAAAVADMVTVVVTPAQAAAATWSR